MAKRKNAKSLFEVITENPRTPLLSAPRGDRPSGAQPPQTAASPSAAPESPAGMTIRISQFGAVSAAVGVILLVLLAFLWGRAIGIRSARTGSRPNSPKPAPRLPVGPGAGGGNSVLPAAGSYAGMAPDTFKRTKGYSYLVIQSNVRLWQDGLAIKKFLYEQGIKATVNPDPQQPGWYEVKDTRGFIKIRTPEVRAQLAEHKTKIERLGKLYSRLTGTGQRQGRPYDFKGPWKETEK